MSYGSIVSCLYQKLIPVAFYFSFGIHVSYYKSHLFICTNIKPGNKNCCGTDSSESMLAYAKQKAKSLGMTKDMGYRISSSGCMGRCKLGPVMVEYPSGKWYKYNTLEDIDQLLLSILNNQNERALQLEIDIV